MATWRRGTAAIALAWVQRRDYLDIITRERGYHARHCTQVGDHIKSSTPAELVTDGPPIIISEGVITEWTPHDPNHSSAGSAHD